MKRRDFFKSLSAGTAALLVAPALLGKEKELDDLKPFLLFHSQQCTPEQDQYASLYSAQMEPSVWKELIKRYGDMSFNELTYYLKPL